MIKSPYPWLNNSTMRLNQQLDNPPQAICLIGVPGLGQDELADCFARAILEIDKLEMHPDYLFIAAESGKSIGIDTVRDMSGFCLIPPTTAKRKIVRVQALESMTLPAQQAFLKTLEEPVIPTTFLITCSQPNKLLPTIRSRCQLMTLASVSYSEIKPWLIEQNIDVTPEDYALSDGGPLLLGTPEFEIRQEGYRVIIQSLPAKTLTKAEPNDVLTGFYYALMHSKKFDLLDKCIALRKQYSENGNLNWEMQLNSFLVEVLHAR